MLCVFWKERKKGSKGCSKKIDESVGSYIERTGEHPISVVVHKKRLKIDDDERHSKQPLDEMKSLGSQNRIITSQLTASCRDLWLNRIVLLASSSCSKQAFVHATTDGNPGSLILYYYQNGHNSTMHLILFYWVMAEY